MHYMHKVGLEPCTSILIVQSLTIMLSHHEWYKNRFNIYKHDRKKHMIEKVESP